MSGLDGYLNDHLAAAAAIRLAQRCRARQHQSELGRVVQALLVESEEDRGVLHRVIAAPGGSANPVKRASAVGMERLGSLRMALPVLGPGWGEAARLEELEVLSLGIRASGCSGRSSGRWRARRGDSSVSISPGSNVGPTPSAIACNPSGYSSPPLRSPVEPLPAADELTPKLHDRMPSVNRPSRAELPSLLPKRQNSRGYRRTSLDVA